MNPFQAIKSLFSKAFLFSGRASRSEYWYGMMFLGVCFKKLINNFFGKIILLININQIMNVFPYALFCAFIMTAEASLRARRLHDLNCSGWWQIIWYTSIYSTIFFSELIKYKSSAMVGLIFTSGLLCILTFLFFFLRRGTVGPNKYGPDPLAPKST